MESEMLYYDFLSAYKQRYRRDLLFPENVVGGQIKIDKMTTPDGDEDNEYNFWGYKLEKDKVKYLLSSVDGKTEKEISLKDTLPIKAKGLFKLASKGEVFYYIQKPVPMRYTPERTMSFKELVDFLSSLEHSNPTHYKLMWLVALSQIFTRTNFRISTPPGFGKDSTVDILGNLIGNCATIESPTLAKLEERSVYLKQMAINEVVDLAPSEWRTIQQFLLAAGAFKPEITKHSRAYKETGEVLDISNLSLLLMYNDIDCYSDSSSYIDFVSKAPLLDRFAPIRFNGRMLEKFNKSKHKDAGLFAEEHEADYTELIKNIVYYNQAFSEHVTRYESEAVNNFMNSRVPQRWKTNVGRLLSVIDMYSQDKMTYEQLSGELLRAMDDYNEMLRYPTMLPGYYKRLHIPETKSDKFNTIQDLEHFQVANKDDRVSYTKSIINAKTFKEKNLLLSEYSNQKTYKDIGGDDFWEN